jgi:glutathione synthase/RimK-type ligase-like ATP-grasp enzyme
MISSKSDNLIMIAIHDRKDSFSEEWIKYCEKKGIPFKIVDCYKSDIINELHDCDALMWHIHHAITKDIIFAKQLMFSLETVGKSVFPDFRTMWHFDDKIGQKYLLEAFNAPLVPSYVFYKKADALRWVNETVFPKVFKLRGGASSINVKLVKTKADAVKLVRRGFGSGFRSYSAFFYLKESIRKQKLGSSSFIDILRNTIRLVYKSELDKYSHNEKGYIYFQDFVPNNDHDIRVIVIDGKIFAVKRMVRDNDFRASGSGVILYNKELFDKPTLKLSLEIAKKLRSQCVAFDFIYQGGNPMIVEISYGFSLPAYKDCPGYWTEDLIWHEGEFNPYGWMVDNVISEMTK